MWKKICEFPRLLLINLILTVKGTIEYCRVVWRYYFLKEFRRADLALLRAYLFKNPYRIHKEYMRKQGKEEIYLYGETYLTTLEIIANQAAITAEDVYVELGCGRARTCFWMRCFKGCQTIGIDYVPAFIERAQAVAQKTGLDRIQFYCEDLFLKEWPSGSVYYLDATLFEGEEIAALIRLCDALPSGTKFISVNFSLTGDYAGERPQWQLLKEFSVPFPWGASTVSLFLKSFSAVKK